MSSPINKLTIALIAAFGTLVASLPVYADDTEVYLGNDSYHPVAPNVLFIIDTSGSMGDRPAGATTGDNKITIVKNVFDTLIDNTSGINAALMRYDNRSGANNQGGYFIAPMTPLNHAARNFLKQQVASLSAHGSTPLAETMFEATRFYMGGAVDFGQSTSPAHNDNTAADTMNAAKTSYISPISDQCQKNYVVLLTDGAPTSDSDADDDINNLITGNATSTPSADRVCDFGSSTGGDCLDELAGYIHAHDLIPNATVAGNNTVETYTIGFAASNVATLLSATATAGGGKYYSADDQAGLTSALSDILDNIVKGNNSFMAPSVALNNFDSLTHLNQLYFAQFQPSYSASWGGNIKSYYLYNDTYASAACATTLLDGNLKPALEDAATCSERYKVKSDAQSFWSASTDGSIVGLGGAADRIWDHSPHKVYTYVGANDFSSSSPIDLTAHVVDTNNSNISKDLLGDPNMTDAEQENLIDWARGVDNTQDPAVNLKKMADAMHSQPVIVTYRQTSANDANMVLFVGTNDGQLHAIDTSIKSDNSQVDIRGDSTDGTVSSTNEDSGQQLYSFIPQELLKNVKPYMDDNFDVPHPYGLDGPITAWVNDIDKDGSIVNADGSSQTHTVGTDTVTEGAYLYVGMRRGGRNYYAFDVSVKDSPKLMWVIQGGTGDFAKLGQTWSKPTLATIQDPDDSTKTEKVLIFGGGYDTNQDTDGAPSTDSVGNAVYIVDALTGDRVWWASSSGATKEVASMTNSIPGDVRVADTNLDGIADLIYVSDTHGQLFRFDLPDGHKWAIDKLDSKNNQLLTTINGGLVASLGGTDTANNRRFYYAPDLVIARPAGGQPYLSINIGSGYRAHPLSTTTTDKFYVLRDDNVVDAPTSYSAANLTSVWSETFSGGEKVLAPSITFDGLVFFTTYTPPPASNDTCTPPGGGTGRFYAVNLFDGTPVLHSPTANPDTNKPEDLTNDDRDVVLKAPGIPPAPTVVFGPDPTPCVGLQCFPKKLSVSINKTYWEQAQ